MIETHEGRELKMARPRKVEPIVIGFTDATPEEKQAIQELLESRGSAHWNSDERREMVLSSPHNLSRMPCQVCTRSESG